MKSENMPLAVAIIFTVVFFIGALVVGLLAGEKTVGSAAGEDLLKDPLTCYTIREYKNEYVRVWTDPDTEIEYLIYTATGRGGICPRYNPDGSLRIGGVGNE